MLLLMAAVSSCTWAVPEDIEIEVGAPDGAALYLSAASVFVPRDPVPSEPDQAIVEVAEGLELTCELDRDGEHSFTVKRYRGVASGRIDTSCALDGKTFQVTLVLD